MRNKVIAITGPTGSGKSSVSLALAKRLDKKDIYKIGQQAKQEYVALSNLQQEIASELLNYMTDEDIGFNETVRRLNMSPTQVIKIQKGKANLTLASIAHISALLKKTPHLTFKKI